MDDASFIEELTKKLTDIKSIVVVYLDDVDRVQKRVNSLYKKYTDIKIGDQISSEVVELEKKFKSILRDFISLQNYLFDVKKLENRQVMFLRKRVDAHVEMVISSIAKNLKSFVFNYTLKRMLVSFLSWCKREEKHIKKLMKYYENDVIEKKRTGAEA